MPVKGEDRLLVTPNAAASLLSLAAQIALEVSESIKFNTYKSVFEHIPNVFSFACIMFTSNV